MKKILYITSHDPFEVSSGAHQRSNLLFRALREVGHVDLVCFAENREVKPSESTNYHIKHFGASPNQPKNVKNIFNILIDLLSTNSIGAEDKYCSSIYKKLIYENQYDYIVFRYIQNALMCGVKGGGNIVIDVDDLPEQNLHSLTNLDNNSIIRKKYYLIRAKIVRYFTRKILKNVFHSFFPNEKQVDLVNSSYLPNIPFPFTEQKNKDDKIETSDAGNNILFVGALSWYPNYAGLEYFIENIYPIILKKVPDIKFNIVGKGISEERRKVWNAIPGINLKGFVDDISEEYKNNKVVIAPIYHGAGTNIKVLEAMIYGKNVVVSEFATRGFENVLVNGENIFIAKNDNDFADKVINSLTNNNASVGQKARTTVLENFSYEIFASEVMKVLNAKQSQITKLLIASTTKTI